MRGCLLLEKGPTDGQNLIDPGQILARRIYAITRLTPTMMFANISNALSVMLILWLEDQMRLDAIIWASIVIVMAILLLVRYAAHRAEPFPDTLSRRTYRRTIAQAALMGVLWAYPGLIILPDLYGLAQSFFVALSAGMIAGGAITLYPLPVAAYVFCGAIFTGSFIGFSRAGDSSFWGFALVAVTFSFIIYQSIKRHERIFVSEFKARKILDMQNEHMGEMLETARRDALVERKRSEDRLLQTQKLEAIGQLTAGIAHDFNNLLAAIRGHAELLALSDRAESELIDPIIKSSDRGAELVRRLLAFARQQTLEPRPVCLRGLIYETAELMQRTLREDIEVKVDFAVELWDVLIDESLLSSAILNLGMNARDSMPDGGMITFSLINLPKDENPSNLSGDFVRLSVHDTGAGMTNETQRRAIEPFFTTKEFGTGSGLGLSMVYGFAMQSGGTMTIESAPGQGTEVNLFLPRSIVTSDLVTEDTPNELPTGNCQRVLLVEDDPSVQLSLIKLLESLDYTVTATESAEAAKEVMLHADECPDIIVSDIVLQGGQRGTDFIREIRHTHSNLAVLLISGYAAVDGTILDDIDKDVLRLSKPFGRAQLAVAMVQALENKR